MNFIKEHPYPDYDLVSKQLILQKRKDLEQYAEYGEINHDLLKEICENIFDKDIVKRNGEMIYKRGGM